MKNRAKLLLRVWPTFLLITPLAVHSLEVGFGIVDVTPYDFESRPNPHKGWKKGKPFYDTGVDQKFDYEEASAFGPDGKPGVAGVDDDNNGVVDDCARNACKEYLASGSDDLADPAKDNAPNGSEGDGKYQFVHLAGFGPYYPIIAENRMAVGVHDPIWSRAMAVTHEGNTVIMISVDSPGIVWKYINPVRRRIEKELGVSRDNVVISATHVHSAPDASGYWSSLLKGHEDWYAERLMEWMFESAEQALAKQKPALMRVAHHEPVGCYDPKTNEIKREPNCKLPPYTKYLNNDPNGEWDRPMLQNDYRAPVVRNTKIGLAHFIDPETHATIGTFVNWSNHPDSLGDSNMQISSDFVHYIRRYIETELGGDAVYFSGTVGCQIGSNSGTFVPFWDEHKKPHFHPEKKTPEGNPFPIEAKDRWNKIRSLGYQIGHEVVETLTQPGEYTGAPFINAKTEPVDTQVRNFLHLIGTRRVWKANVEKQDKMKRYFPRCLFGYGCVRSDISLIQLGKMSLITAPGEMDPAYFFGRPEMHVKVGEKKPDKTFPALPGVRDYMPGEVKVVLGQANNYLSYMLHRKDNFGWWNFQHPIWYEEFVTTDKNFGDDVGNKMMQMLGSTKRYKKRRIYPRSRTVRKIKERQRRELEQSSENLAEANALGLEIKKEKKILSKPKNQPKHTPLLLKVLRRTAKPRD